MLVALHTVLSRGYVKSPRVKRFLIAWEESLELARLYLIDAIDIIKRWEDKDRQDTHFEAGDMFFLWMMKD